MFGERLGSFEGGRGSCNEPEKWEKAQPGALNEVRKTGEVEREENTEGFTEKGAKVEDNERREEGSVLIFEGNEPVLEDDSDKVGEVEDELNNIVEAPENKDEELGDDDEEVEGIANEFKGDPKEV